MGTKSKDITVGEEDFVVREISIGEVMPILPRLSIPEEAQEAQFDIMRLCILVDGTPIGDKLTDIGISVYLKLAEAVMDINGLSTVGKD